jgi:hypothetical protein
MAKQTYDYTQVKIPEEAKEAFDALHGHLSEETKLRKGDLWIAVMKSFLWLTEEQQQNALEDVGVKMYNKK